MNLKYLLRLLLVCVGLLLVIASCADLNPNSCESRCMDHDEACIVALELDGIAPARDDPQKSGLCNGVCSAIRIADEAGREEWELMGLEGAFPVHACLRPPDS